MFFTQKYKNLIKKTCSTIKQLFTSKCEQEKHLTLVINDKTSTDVAKSIQQEAQKNEFEYIQVNDLYFKVANHWFWDEYIAQGWEPQTYDTFKAFLSKDITFLDVGTWVGVTTFFAAELGVKKIYGIEANPLTFELVSQNCSMNKLLKGVSLSNLYVTNIDDELVDFGGNNGANTSSASSIRGKDWQVKSTKILTYLTEKNIIQDDLFIKIDIEGAEELILQDLEKLSEKENLTIYLSLYPTFMENKNLFCEEFLKICSKFKYVLDCNLTPLKLDKLQEMITSSLEFPKWGTKFGNFFEITVSNTPVNYKSYWTQDKCDNIIPLNYSENPEGFDPKETIKKLLENKNFSSVLDFGCGYGRLSQAFDKEKYIGIDLNPNALEIAKKNNHGYTYEEVNVTDINYPIADLALAYTVFLHLDETTIKKTLTNLLKNVGRYFIIAEIFGREWRRGGLPPVFNREKEEYIELMEKFSFNLVNEVSKPYMRYLNDPTYADKKNKNITFLLFEKKVR